MSERRNTIYLRNNIECNSLGFPRFVPKCAQNVPTATRRGVDVRVDIAGW